jgi:hypothetical protein
VQQMYRIFSFCSPFWHNLLMMHGIASVLQVFQNFHILTN